MKTNRLFLLLAALLSCVSGVRAENESAAAIFTNANLRPIPARRTSIIYIQWHGLGYGDLSCYGQTNFLTPNLDRLAAEAVALNVNDARTPRRDGAQVGVGEDGRETFVFRAGGGDAGQQRE